MPRINPTFVALLAGKAGRGDEEALTTLATLINSEKPGGPPDPTTIASAPKPFPAAPRGGGGPGAGAGAGLLGVANNPAPQPIPPAAPQALEAASNQSALGGGIPGSGQGAGIGADALGGLGAGAVQLLPALSAFLGGGGGGAGGALGGLFGGGGGSGAVSSAGPALAGGLPSGAAAGAAGGGVNPLEALVPPTPGEQPQQPRAIAPRSGGGQIDPQLMQLILQSLRTGGGQQVQQQSLGSILGQLR